MADRRVKRSGKDNNGNITKLCGDGWESRSKQDAISDIEGGVHVYYVEEVAPRVNVKVVTEGDLIKNKYLRTVKDETSENNLDNLPNC